MKPVLRKRLVFIAKSALWSVLLYIVLMLSFNWDDVSTKVRDTNPITVINNINSPQTPPANDPAIIPSTISHNVSIVGKIITLAKTIGKIVGIATK